MRLAILKVKKYDTKISKWVSSRSNSPIYKPRIFPDKIITLFMDYNLKETTLEFLTGKGEPDKFILDMTLEEAETEINNALNYTPGYLIDESIQLKYIPSEKEGK